MTSTLYSTPSTDREVDLLAATALGLAIADTSDTAELLRSLANSDRGVLAAAQTRLGTLEVTDPSTRQAAASLLNSAGSQLAVTVTVPAKAVWDAQRPRSLGEGAVVVERDHPGPSPLLSRSWMR